MKAKMLNWFLLGVIVFILLAVLVGNPVSLIKNLELPSVPEAPTKTENNSKQKKKKVGNRNPNKFKKSNKNEAKKKEKPIQSKTTKTKSDKALTGKA